MKKIYLFAKWMVTQANSEGWRIFYYGACLGGIIGILFCFPFRYKIEEADNPHLMPIWLKFDRLTGTAWKTVGYDGTWNEITNSPTP